MQCDWITANFAPSVTILDDGSALDLGYEILSHQGKSGPEIIEKIAAFTSGEILGTGKVIKKDIIYTDEAFDIGQVHIKVGHSTLIVHVQNEYMAVDSKSGKRLTTYPDVISLFRTADAHPLSTNEIELDQEVTLFKIDKSQFPLSSGVTDPSVYPEVEEALGIELYRYAFPGE